MEGMKYKIGDVARILGISTDLLRYYEKTGVVRPVKDKANDYRYYEAWDINFLMDCLWMKGFGFGIEEIGHMVTSCPYDELMDHFRHKEGDLAEELKWKELVLRRLRRHRKEVAAARDYVGKCDLRPSPEMVRYLNRHNFVYDSSPELAALSQEWLKYMPLVRRCFEIEQSDLTGGSDYSWGLALDMEYVEELGVRVSPPACHLPSVPAIHSVFKSAGKDAFSPRHLDYLVNYAEAHNFRVCGNARGNLVCSVVEDGTLTGYFEVWVPVCD